MREEATMRRREFFTLLGGAAVWPIATAAQQQATPVVGFLGTASAQAYTERIAAISRGLKEKGFVEGANLRIEYRWAEGYLDRLPALAADLVEHKVDLIIATGGSPAPLSAKAATATIPIVFSTDGDPIKEGLVASFNRPGGNATGITVQTTALAAKRLEIFRTVIQKDGIIAVLVNRSTSAGVEQSTDADQAGQSLGQKTVLVDVTSDSEIEVKLAGLATDIVGLVITASPLFMARREHLIALANRYRIPTLGPRRDFVTAGAMMSYGPNVVEPYRQLGQYAGRILKGEMPADLPVQQPTKFDLVINLKTAKAMGVDIPPTLLATADEVIE
jgi:putative tryptophan/tyrosine transport system substrate-binding protein